MKPFEPAELPTPAFVGSERFLTFMQALRDALIPLAGPATSIQGELLRANDRVTSELLRDGLTNYYVEDEAVEANYYGELLCFMLDTLIANANGAVSAADVVLFSEARQRLAGDRVLALLQRKVEQAEEEPTAAELAQLEALEANTPAVRWEEMLARAFGCIANWCIANPKLIDRRGKPVEVNGLRDLKQLGKKPEAPPPCPICNGKGFVPQVKETAFPELCVCKGGRART